MKRRPTKQTKKRGLDRPSTKEQYLLMPEEEQERWNRMAHVISQMRSEGTSLTRAAAEFSINRSTVVRLAGSSISKQENGRYKAKKADKIPRFVIVPLEGTGLSEVAVNDSRVASTLARFDNAVQTFLRTGDASELDTFRGVDLRDASGKKILLLLDKNELKRLGAAGVLSFESLYARM